MRAWRALDADGLLVLGSLFGAGVFLGAGLILVLPDSVGLFARLYPEIDYPVPFAIVATGLIAGAALVALWL